MCNATLFMPVQQKNKFKQVLLICSSWVKCKVWTINAQGAISSLTLSKIVL